jgi:hypothetical protein
MKFFVICICLFASLASAGQNCRKSISAIDDPSIAPFHPPDERNIVRDNLGNGLPIDEELPSRWSKFDRYVRDSMRVSSDKFRVEFYSHFYRTKSENGAALDEDIEDNNEEVDCSEDGTRSPCVDQ